MKKRTMIALIVAVALILTGGILVVLGLSFAADPARDSKLIQQDLTVAEPFDSIYVDTKECDVHVVMLSGGENAMVQLQEYEAVSHSVTVEDGVLKIKMTDSRSWKDYIGVFSRFGEMKMTLSLPAAALDSLQVRTDTGDITIQAAPTFREMVLRSSTGNISCVGVSSDTLDCMTSTGDISVQNSTPNLTKLQSDTGDFMVSTLAGDELHMTTNTGEVDAGNVNGRIVTCSSDSGDVELEQVLAEEYLQIFTDTGEVEAENSDAGKVNIQTNTGDVSGHFLTSKWFQAHSDTGNVQVPMTREGGECCIQSDTGDIHFE